jgi:hypothetical protein
MKDMRTLLCAALVLTGGCTSYYKVTDPTTSRSYYTTELKKGSHGSATLKDARTGNEVTIQNSEIDSITKEEYETGRHAAAQDTGSTPSNAFK